MLKCKSSPRAAMLVAALTMFPAAGYAQDTIKIGAPFSLSGRFVSYGAAGKRGVDMCVDTYGGKVGGKKIEVIFRDTQSDAEPRGKFVYPAPRKTRSTIWSGRWQRQWRWRACRRGCAPGTLIVPGATTPLLEEKVGKSLCSSTPSPMRTTITSR